MPDLTEAIRRAHALEVHPSAGQLIPWSDRQLAEYPAQDVRWDDITQNVVLRVTYAKDEAKSEFDADADYPMPLPLTDDTIRLASSVSLHGGVFGTALYEVYEDGNLAPKPAIAFADGCSYNPFTD